MWSSPNTPRRHPSWVLSLGLTLLVVMSLSTPSAAQGFFTTVTDLPLMGGMVELTDEALFYDKPEGRIVEVTAHGEVKRADVVGFYTTTLPQLGWQPQGDQYERDGERLSITYQQTGGVLRIRLSINPK